MIIVGIILEDHDDEHIQQTAPYEDRPRRWRLLSKDGRKIQTQQRPLSWGLFLRTMTMRFSRRWRTTRTAPRREQGGTPPYPGD